jgi:hypothetical protein
LFVETDKDDDTEEEPPMKAPRKTEAKKATLKKTRLGWRSSSVQNVYDQNLGVHADPEIAQQICYAYMAFKNCECGVCEHMGYRGFTIFPLSRVAATRRRYLSYRDESVEHLGLPGAGPWCEMRQWEERVRQVASMKGYWAWLAAE